jgi:FKBP-type peptidyl-prolyl cis-trans isomerase
MASIIARRSNILLVCAIALLLFISSSISIVHAAEEAEEASAASTEVAAPAVPKVKACTGSNLDPDSEPRVGVLKKKECFHFQKSSFGKYLRIEYKLYRFADCELVRSSESDGYPFIFELGTRTVREALNIGLSKMCVGERRRITAPAKHAYGARHTLERTGEQVSNNC